MHQYLKIHLIRGFRQYCICSILLLPFHPFLCKGFVLYTLTFVHMPAMRYISEMMKRETGEGIVDKVRLGIVDDQKATIASLASIFQYSKGLSVTVTAQSGSELFERLKRLRQEDLPEIIITDVNMPGMSGIEVVRHGKALYPNIHFVMLSVFDDEDTLFQSIRAGASGYLLKGENASVIVSQLEQFMENGAITMSPLMARKTLDLLAHSSKPVSGTEIIELEGLSAREKDVLYLLVEGKDYKEIASRLSISPNTVRTHISNVYLKLHISSKSQAIRLLQGQKSTTQALPVKDRIKLLLVDDHEMILESLSIMLSAMPDFEVVGSLSDPRKVDTFLANHKVHLVVTDFHMPGMDGLQLSRQIRANHPEVRILMLTVSEDPEQVSQAIGIGINGFVLKKASKEELSRALKEVAMGGHFITGGMANVRPVS